MSAPSSSVPPSANGAAVDCKDEYEFHPSLSEEERAFYVKAYPTIDVVREKKTHCTVCKTHIGTAAAQEPYIKMHPILRVTHCTKCHDFYNSGEFSKGEDGSELYCRWCGQGGEVYCCSNCPYVFCKSCIVKNLSRGVVTDIEQNENWSCFSCSTKILWPLRAMHWALTTYIKKQRKHLESLNLPEIEFQQQMAKDTSTCCRLAKAKCGNMSDSMESLDSVNSRRSHGSGTTRKLQKSSPAPGPSPKRPKTSNDEVVCTPDLLSMLEPDCEITVTPKARQQVSAPVASSPKIMSLQPGYMGQSTSAAASKGVTAPPPLVLRNTGLQMRPVAPQPIVRRTIVGARPPAPLGGTSPVYHNINGFRIDLNVAAQQETFRLPNGKLIQVKRQGNQTIASAATANNSWQPRTSTPTQQRVTTTIQQAPQAGNRPIQITQIHAPQIYQTMNQQQQQQHQTTLHQQQQQPQQQHVPQSHPQIVRYHNTMAGGANTVVHHRPANVGQNGNHVQVVNGVPTAPVQGAVQGQVRPQIVRHVFPDTAIGHARSQLQDEVFNCMDICQHLIGKVHSLTNSNAYKQARNYLEVKELYIHLSYLLTYAIGRYKGLQDKCLADMRQLGFVTDADSLENGQLAAGVDFVRYAELNDVNLFDTGCNSFHNQVYEYRKSLHANMEESEQGPIEPLPPLFPLGVSQQQNDGDDFEEKGNNLAGEAWQSDEESQMPPFDDAKFKEEMESYLDGYVDDEPQDDNETDDDRDDAFASYVANNTYNAEFYSRRSTEDVMSRVEQSHAYDRKLTRLIEQYPSIWCTKHPDYGNFDVTRKQWRNVASHFHRTENIKLRWKNIRKRYVRIERRMREGKRFNGYFDKATNFLANRDRAESNWLKVDRGEDDGDTYDAVPVERSPKKVVEERVERPRPRPGNGQQPLEITSLDMRIINFVKSNPTLWRNSQLVNKNDRQTRHALWSHLWKSMPQYDLDFIIERWLHLYEMYKSFRLKTIKDPEIATDLELKYSKYLTKLYFLYKIDEEDLKNEAVKFEDNVEDVALPEDTRLQDMEDDQEFMAELVPLVRQYHSLWDKRDVDFYDANLRNNIWQDIASKLAHFNRDANTIKLRWQLAKHSYFILQREQRKGAINPNDPLIKSYKQASDDEDNEIEIVEPKTDLINLDSDEEDAPAPKPPTPQKVRSNPLPIIIQSNSAPPMTVLPMAPPQMPATQTAAPSIATPPMTVIPTYPQPGTSDYVSTTVDSSMEAMDDPSFLLASLLDVEFTEGDHPLASISPPDAVRKQPRKKTTNKPNPTLIKQKQLLMNERLEEMKRNDVKLKQACNVVLSKVEHVYPWAKELMEKYKEKEDEEVTCEPELIMLSDDDDEPMNPMKLLEVEMEGGETSKTSVISIDESPAKSESSNRSDNMIMMIDVDDDFEADKSKTPTKKYSTLEKSEEIIAIEDNTSSPLKGVVEAKSDETTPSKNTTPPKVKTPTEAITPTKSTTPANSTTPTKLVTPTKPISPTKPTTPPTAATTTKSDIEEVIMADKTAGHKADEANKSPGKDKVVPETVKTKSPEKDKIIPETKSPEKEKDKPEKDKQMSPEKDKVIPETKSPEKEKDKPEKDKQMSPEKEEEKPENREPSTASATQAEVITLTTAKVAENIADEDVIPTTISDKDNLNVPVGVDEEGDDEENKVELISHTTEIPEVYKEMFRRIESKDKDVEMAKVEDESDDSSDDSDEAVDENPAIVASADILAEDGTNKVHNAEDLKATDKLPLKTKDNAVSPQKELTNEQDNKLNSQEEQQKAKDDGLTVEDVAMNDSNNDEHSGKAPNAVGNVVLTTLNDANEEHKELETKKLEPTALVAELNEVEKLVEANTATLDESKGKDAEKEQVEVTEKKSTEALDNVMEVEESDDIQKLDVSSTGVAELENDEEMPFPADTLNDLLKIGDIDNEKVLNNETAKMDVDESLELADKALTAENVVNDVAADQVTPAVASSSRDSN